MIPKIVEARYTADYRVWLRFADGVNGEVDLENELWGEVFAPLKDKTKFNKSYLDRELETVVWPGGADFAPEFFYAKLRPDYTPKPTLRTGAV